MDCNVIVAYFCPARAPLEATVSRRSAPAWDRAVTGLGARGGRGTLLWLNISDISYVRSVSGKYCKLYWCEPLRRVGGLVWLLSLPTVVVTYSFAGKSNKNKTWLNIPEPGSLPQKSQFKKNLTQVRDKRLWVSFSNEFVFEMIVTLQLIYASVSLTLFPVKVWRTHGYSKDQALVIGRQPHEERLTTNYWPYL